MKLQGLEGQKGGFEVLVVNLVQRSHDCGKEVKTRRQAGWNG